MRQYLVEIEGYNPANLTVETVRFCTGQALITRPTEIPANTLYSPRVKQAGSITANMFTNGSVSGSSHVGYGEILLNNIDGALDYLADWGFDGRKVVVRKGVVGGVYPDDFPILYTATVQQTVPEFSKFSFRLRDKQYILDKSVQNLKFAGNNALPDGLEGVANDIKDKPKPMVIGKVWNVSPVCVNTTKLIYALNIRKTTGIDSSADFDAIGSLDGFSGGTAFNAGVSVYAAYDSGAALTAGPVYNTEEEMLTNIPTAGTYRVYPAGGYIRLGLLPTGAFTVDCIDLESVTNQATVANLIKNLLIQEAALPESEINLDDFTTINTYNSDAIGFYLTDDVKFPAIFDSFCSSIGAWYGFDRLGIFRIKQIRLPLTNPTVFINNSTSYERLSVSDTANGIPAQRLIMSWRKNYTVIKGTEIVGVSNDRKSQIEIEYREKEVKDPSVLEKHLLADVVRVTTAFYDEPTLEAERQFSIFKSRRDRFRIRVSLEQEGAENLLNLGTVAQVTLPRFGLSTGKNLMVIGFILDCSNNYIDAILWG